VREEFYRSKGLTDMNIHMATGGAALLPDVSYGTIALGIAIVGVIYLVRYAIQVTRRSWGEGLFFFSVVAVAIFMTLRLLLGSELFAKIVYSGEFSGSVSYGIFVAIQLIGEVLFYIGVVGVLILAARVGSQKFVGWLKRIRVNKRIKKGPHVDVHNLVEASNGAK